MIDLPRLRLMAQLSSAAYEPGQEKAAALLKGLGYDFRALITNGGSQDQGDCQALVGANDKEQIVAFRGTQVASHLSWTELWDDVAVQPIHLSMGQRAMGGFFYPLATIIGDISRFLDLRQPVVWTGHSKGGSHTHLVPELLPWGIPFVGYSFGAPECADENYWRIQVQRPSFSLTRVEVLGDFAPHWPLISAFNQPGVGVDHVVLTREGAEAAIAPTPFVLLDADSLAKHSIDDSYLKLLAPPSAAPLPAASTK